MPRSITALCLAAAQLVCLPASRADGTPVVKLAYQEINPAGSNGEVFALGSLPYQPGKLYWGVEEADVAHIYSYDLGSSAVTELTGVIPDSFSPNGLTWSPDGRQVALARGPLLKLVGIGVRKIQNLFMGTGQWGSMFWTPNHSILTACAPDAQTTRRLCAVDTTTGLATVLATPGEGSVYVVGYVEGVNKVIYERWNPGEAPNPVHLYVAAIFSDHVGNLMPLSYPDIHSQGYVTATPDGAYGVTLGQPTQAKRKSADVYLGDFNTGDWVRVPSPAAWGEPVMAVLSPDHRHLVVATSDGKGRYHVWLADVPGGSLEPVNKPH